MITLSEREEEALTKLVEEMDMSEEAIMRQALRLYQYNREIIRNTNNFGLHDFLGPKKMEFHIPE